MTQREAKFLRASRQTEFWHSLLVGLLGKERKTGPEKTGVGRPERIVVWGHLRPKQEEKPVRNLLCCIAKENQENMKYWIVSCLCTMLQSHLILPNTLHRSIKHTSLQAVRWMCACQSMEWSGGERRAGGGGEMRGKQVGEVRWERPTAGALWKQEYRPHGVRTGSPPLPRHAISGSASFPKLYKSELRHLFFFAYTHFLGQGFLKWELQPIRAL